MESFEKLDNIKSQMRKGMLEYCILLLLSNGKYYPSDIIKALDGVKMIVVEGTLYTLLSRLRREGKLDYEWQESPKGPPRKYYFITPAGSEHLSMMKEAWTEIRNAVDYFSTLECEVSDTDNSANSKQNQL